MPIMSVREHTVAEYEISAEDHELLKSKPWREGEVIARSTLIDEKILDWETNIYE